MENLKVISLRMQRQHFLSPVNEAEYNSLFRLLSPVQTEYWCQPGYPPTISFRSENNDYAYCYRLRANRELIKGRFQSGGIAYIFSDEIELFAAAYKKEKKEVSYAEEEILGLLRSEGPMSIQLMKKITGILVKNIAPVLHKLQESFLIFEDQSDNEWDRAWYLFETEFPDANLNKYTRTEAIKILILRFAYLNMVFDEKNIRSFYRFSTKDICIAIFELIAENKLQIHENGYILTDDVEEIRNCTCVPIKSVFALHRNDFLVKSNEHILKEKYKHDAYDVRFYLLIDGEFKGAVYGFFKFSDVPIEDILLDLSEEDAEIRKDEILFAVGKVINFSTCPLKRYNGKEMEQ